jgi:hypothetical protein
MGGRKWWWNFNDVGYGRWKRRRRGDGCGIFQRGRRRDGSTVSEADNTMKSGMMTREAEGGGGHLEVEDEQRKLDRWAECVVEPNC